MQQSQHFLQELSLLGKKTKKKTQKNPQIIKQLLEFAEK